LLGANTKKKPLETNTYKKEIAHMHSSMSKGSKLKGIVEVQNVKVQKFLIYFQRNELMNIIELETKRIGTRKEKEYESFIESKHMKKKYWLSLVYF
jgi:predicted DNA-binding protein (MmcQ/YjbR family)